MTVKVALPTLQRVPRRLVALALDLEDGAEIAPHRHPRSQLVYAAGGVLTVMADGGTWTVPPQRAVWMPAGVRHAIRCSGAVAMRTVYVEPGAAPELPAAARVLQVTPLLRALLLEAVRLPALYDESGRDGRLVALLLDEIARLPAAPLHLPMPRDPRARRVAEAVLAEPAARRTLDAWARLAATSPRTLARLFRAETGLSLGAWRQQARLQAALAWLAEGRGVSATAFALGYDSASAFIAMFRRALGEPPGRYLARRSEAGSRGDGPARSRRKDA